jgi:hypothetical protein
MKAAHYLVIGLTSLLFSACSSTSVMQGVGAVGLASDAMLKPDYLSAALLTYAIYDPSAPNWEIQVVQLDEEHVRFDLKMRSLATGGEGEARQIFMRNARNYAHEGGFAGFDVLSYEEGIESSRPFAKRFATGEIRLAKSKPLATSLSR